MSNKIKATMRLIRANKTSGRKVTKIAGLMDDAGVSTNRGELSAQERFDFEGAVSSSFSNLQSGINSLVGSLNKLKGRSTNLDYKIHKVNEAIKQLMVSTEV